MPTSTCTTACVHTFPRSNYFPLTLARTTSLLPRLTFLITPGGISSVEATVTNSVVLTVVMLCHTRHRPPWESISFLAEEHLPNIPGWNQAISRKQGIAG